jgi:hypothetical protein
MRVAFLALGLMLLAAPAAIAGTIPDPDDYCTITSVCYCYVASTFEGINQGPPDTDIFDVPGWYIDCSNQAIDCLSEQFLAECLVG